MKHLSPIIMTQLVVIVILSHLQGVINYKFDFPCRSQQFSTVTNHMMSRCMIRVSRRIAQSLKRIFRGHHPLCYANPGNQERTGFTSYLQTPHFLSHENKWTFPLRIDNYAKDGRPGVVWPSCSFHHDPLRYYL